MTLRHLCFVFFASATLLELACSDAAPDAAPAGAGMGQTGDDPAAEQANPGVESGQTGSIGPSQCLRDTDCELFAAQRLSELEQPLPEPPRFDRAECIMAGTTVGPDGQGGGVGPACSCRIAGTSGSRQLGPALSDDCTVRGRLGECLASPSDFPGCQIESESAACQVLCDDLQERMAADAARTFDAEVHSSHCVRNPNNTVISYSCQQIFEVDGGCYARFGANAQRFDCSLSDEEILAGAAQVP